MLNFATFCNCYETPLDLKFSAVYYFFVFKFNTNTVLNNAFSSFKVSLKRFYVPYAKPKHSTPARRIHPQPVLSPEYCPVEEDFKLFEEARKKYGVHSNEDEKSKMLKKESSHLLSELNVFLNNSESKLVCVGLDVFDNFNPCIRIQKPGLDHCVNFSYGSFIGFINSLQNIIESLRCHCEEKYELADYTVYCTISSDDCDEIPIPTAKFVPKNKGDNFHIHLASTTLQKLYNIRNFLVRKLKSFEDINFVFNGFIVDVVNVLNNKKKTCVENEDVVNVLCSRHQDDIILSELVYKFPNFVIGKIKDNMEDYGDRHLYI
ncbi:hypothetical protein RN001_009699 [Aquatica leii]|uniref:Uncharacterized protein n=1 Tax=Aquatica leii TaxID=1421715 RepID=A0AAN7P703_9COLE|nr:hypothetical protein RN001_009699 [Aquatica leii]